MGLRSRLNIGGADVDTQLHGDGSPGYPLPGVVVIQGGKRPQEFRRIYVAVETTYRREYNNETRTVTAKLLEQDVSGPVTVQPGQRLELPLQLVLPPDTPLTLGRSPKVTLRTGLDVENAIDPKDNDVIHVVPNPPQRAVLDAFDRIGMRLHQIEHEYDPRRGGHAQFVQEFEFKPAGGPYQGRIDEIELVFRAAGDGYDCHLEVDRKGRGMRGMFEAVTNRDETRTGFRVGPAEVAGGVVDGLLVGTVDRAL